MKNRIWMIFIAIEAGLLLLAWGGGLFFHIGWWKNFHFYPWMWAGAALGALLWGLAWLLFQGLASRRIFHTRWMLDELLYPLAKDLNPAQIFLLALASGLAEECFFRGWLAPILGIFWANLIFALLHTGSRKLWFAGFWAGLCGLLFSELYRLTDSLGLVIFIHFIYNGLGLVYLSRFYHPKESSQKAGISNPV